MIRLCGSHFAKKVRLNSSIVKPIDYNLVISISMIYNAFGFFDLEDLKFTMRRPSSNGVLTQSFSTNET